VRDLEERYATMGVECLMSSLMYSRGYNMVDTDGELRYISEREMCKKKIEVFRRALVRPVKRAQIDGS